MQSQRGRQVVICAVTIMKTLQKNSILPGLPTKIASDNFEGTENLFSLVFPNCVSLAGCLLSAQTEKSYQFIKK